MGSGTRSKSVGFLILAAFVLVLGATSGAYALTDPVCDALCGSIVGYECQISLTSINGCTPSNPSNKQQGTFSVRETLHILGDGFINVPKLAGGNTLELDIAGNFIMDAGATIVGDAGASPNDSSAKAATIIINANGNPWKNGDITLAGGARITSDQKAGSCNGGRAGNVTLEAAGNITTAGGSVISADGTKCQAGAIVIEACIIKDEEPLINQEETTTFSTSEVEGTTCTIDIDGLVESRSGNSGTGAKQAPGGGPITINAGCNLIISDTGKVSSRGQDPGGDLVHLQGGCDVAILGLVESTGVGHAVPNSPKNHCDSTTHPDKPTNSTACVEVWAGGNLFIVNELPPDSIRLQCTSGKGEINADTGGPGGSSGTSWIDLFARKNISIVNDTLAPYAVHANGNAGTNDNGGAITVKAKWGFVETFGLAIQANALGNGGKGGNVDVEAKWNVKFNAASIQAKGANAGGGSQVGGRIFARSWNAYVRGDKPGELNADGGKGKTPFSLGLVALKGCGTGEYSGTDGVAYNGTVTPILIPLPNECGGSPEIPKGVPYCNCELCSRLSICAGDA